jgi:hypothetical protein
MGVSFANHGDLSSPSQRTSQAALGRDGGRLIPGRDSIDLYPSSHKYRAKNSEAGMDFTVPTTCESPPDGPHHWIPVPLLEVMDIHL